MDWSYIAGFFDGEGNIHTQQIIDKDKKIKSYQIIIRFYNLDLNILKRIQEFLGCGTIYANGGRKNRPNAVHELSIFRKKDVKNVLLNLQKYSISKPEKISYVLKNYNFERDNNKNFNIESFHTLTERKNVGKFYVKREFYSPKFA